MKNGAWERLPVEHILVGLDDIFYSIIDGIQIPVGDDNLDFTLAWVLLESGRMETDGYF